MHIYYALLHSLEDLKFSEEAMRQFRIQFISLLFIYRPNTFKLNATNPQIKFSKGTKTLDPILFDTYNIKLPGWHSVRYISTVFTV